jgi:GTP 3',8-cyclase
LGQVGIIPAVSSHFCGECNRLRITADGRIRTCLLSNEEFDLKSVLRGNADDEALVKFIQAAISAKPERHRIGEADFREGMRRMQGIGG